MPTEIDELRALVREQGERIHALETRLGSAATTPETASEPTRRQLFRLAGAAAAGGVAASLGGAGLAAPLTITDTTSTGGYLALFENGTTWPGNSSINWDAVGRAVANTTVVPLDDQGRFKVRASPGGGTDFVIDVLGYWL